MTHHPTPPPINLNIHAQPFSPHIAPTTQNTPAIPNEAINSQKHHNFGVDSHHRMTPRNAPKRAWMQGKDAHQGNAEEKSTGRDSSGEMRVVEGIVARDTPHETHGKKKRKKEKKMREDAPQEVSKNANDKQTSNRSKKPSKPSNNHPAAAPESKATTDTNLPQSTPDHTTTSPSPPDASESTIPSTKRKRRRKKETAKHAPAPSKDAVKTPIGAAWSNPKATLEVLARPPSPPRQKVTEASTPRAPSRQKGKAQSTDTSAAPCTSSRQKANGDATNPGKTSTTPSRRTPHRKRKESPQQRTQDDKAVNLKSKPTTQHAPAPVSDADLEFPTPAAAKNIAKKSKFSYLDATVKPQQMPKDTVPFVPHPLSLKHPKNQPHEHHPKSLLRERIRESVRTPDQNQRLALDSVAKFASKKDQSVLAPQQMVHKTHKQDTDKVFSRQRHKPHLQESKRPQPAKVDSVVLTEEEQRHQESQQRVRELMKKYLAQIAPPRQIKRVNLKIEKGKKYSMDIIENPEETKKKPTKMKKIILQEREDVKLEQSTTKRRVREYVTTKLTDMTNENVTNLLSKLSFFQKRLKKSQPLKFKQHRRVAVGLKECLKLCKTSRAKALIIAPDIEKISTKGGLDTLVGNVLGVATAQEIPIVFALNRRKIGKAMGSSVKLSAVCVINTEGAHDEFKKMLKDLEFCSYEDELPANYQKESLSAEQGQETGIEGAEEEDGEDGAKESGDDESSLSIEDVDEVQGGQLG